MSKILITGGTGMLGKELKKLFIKSTILNGRLELDLSNLELVEAFLIKNSFDTIIHTAAYTNMEYNEENPTKALDLHCNILEIFNKYSKKLIYISAQGKDYKNTYHQTKLRGELVALKKPNNLIIRTNLYGDGGLVKWAIKELTNGKIINGYNNCVFNPVSTEQLSYIIHKKINCLSGIVNVGSNTLISKYDFLKIIALKFNINPELIHPLKTDNYLDLTVPVEEKSCQFSLLDGIISLKVNT